MRGSAWRWAVAVVITLASAVWQRVSGPTYPARGTVTLGGETIALRLDRSHVVGSDQQVEVRAGNAAVTGELVWRRFPTSEPWQIAPMPRRGEVLSTALPRQPAAGKLEYQVRLSRGGEQAVFPSRPAVTRFRGEVPAAVLIPHILAMFAAMLLATRAGTEALGRKGRPRRFVLGTLGFLLLGGFVLGPLVQRFAFGEWWAGVPFGWDLTDNKTLIALLAWLAALWAGHGGRQGRAAALAAALVTLAVFAVPHSAWGSQLDWSKLPPPTPTVPG
jgi:hypothetical protein